VFCRKLFRAGMLDPQPLARIWCYPHPAEVNFMSKKTFLSLAILVVACFVLSPITPAFSSEPLAVSSPNGDLTIILELKENPQPYLPGERAYYRVAYKGATILADSPLGLDFKDSSPLDRDLEVVSVDRKTNDTKWENRFGANREVRDHYNELTVALRERHAPGRRVDLIFRAYDGGVAFRYSMPRQDELKEFTLSSENTGFYFAHDASAYALSLGGYTTSYETDYHRVSLDRIKPTSLVALPLLVEIPQGPWVALLEADLTNYAGMYLGGVSGVENALRAKLSPHPKVSDQAVTGSAPMATPWRLILVNATAGGIIESSDLVLNLSAPSALDDTSWIQPGKSAWDWWSGSYASGVSFKPGMNTATMKHYIDFAAEHHLEFMLIDAGWSARDDITHTTAEIDMPEILAHAKERGVRILLWLHWTAVDKQIDQAFPLYEKWGVAGVKVDFMDRDDQEMVNFYERVLRKAAEHHLTVDFHGAYKPTGLRRTFPNLLTREGVMGMEYSKWSTRETPEHDATLPFTRMLAGPLDYTPGCFNNATREGFKVQNVQPMCQGTRAHQLAMYVDFLSPLVMLSDYPEDYDHNPGMEFLDKVPTVWDETKVLAGEPGKFVAIARRHGDTWYFGAMTNWDARDLAIPLKFLGSGKYRAQIFSDGPDAESDAKSLSTTSRSVNAGESLSLHLAPGGGAAVIFAPVR
jgi:alpha-glucosidase